MKRNETKHRNKTKCDNRRLYPKVPYGMSVYMAWEQHIKTKSSARTAPPATIAEFLLPPPLTCLTFCCCRNLLSSLPHLFSFLLLYYYFCPFAHCLIVDFTNNTPCPNFVPLTDKFVGETWLN